MKPVKDTRWWMMNVEQCRVDLSAFIFRHRTDILWHHFSLNQGHHRADATQSILDWELLLGVYWVDREIIHTINGVHTPRLWSQSTSGTREKWGRLEDKNRKRAKTWHVPVYRTSTVLPRKKSLDGSCAGRGSALGPNPSQIFLLAPLCTGRGSALGPNPS
jgi:hypothetical protein